MSAFHPSEKIMQQIYLLFHPSEKDYTYPVPPPKDCMQSLRNKETYQVQTNLSMQTIESHFYKSPSHSLSFPYLDVDPMAQIEICIICTKKLVCT